MNVFTVSPLRNSRSSRPPRDGAYRPNLPSCVQLPFHFGIERMWRFVLMSTMVPFSLVITATWFGLCGIGMVVSTSFILQPRNGTLCTWLPLELKTLMQSLFNLSIVTTTMWLPSAVMTAFRKGIPGTMRNGYSNENCKMPVGIVLTFATAIRSPTSSAAFRLIFAHEIDRMRSPNSRNFTCCMPGWSSRHNTCSDTRFQIKNFPVSDDTMYLPSGVISACVTIAPKRLSANFDSKRPDRISHTPTQLRVTVAASPVFERLQMNAIV